MELKNIHSRKDFVNEIFGGTHGGVGANDGFANDAKLKETLLGKLIGGIFKGIGWLWRKSKELFVINKLIAQLVNELMRGVITFCFENNIDLKTGQQTIEEAIKAAQTETEESEKQQVTTASDDTTVTETKMTKEEILKNINEYTLSISEYNKGIIDIKRRIKSEEKNVLALRGKELLDKKAFIEKLKKTLQEREFGKSEDEKELAKYKQMLLDLGETTVRPALNLDNIQKDCKDKYEFDPNNEQLNSEAESLDAIPVSEFRSKFKKINPKVIKIESKYSISSNGVIKDIIVKDVDISKNIVKYEYTDELGKIYEIEDRKILPQGFPSFKAAKDKAELFLKKHSNNYDAMTDEQKKKMQIIYMNYAILNTMMSNKKIVSESIEFSDDEFLNEDIVPKGDVKVRMDEPKAGKVDIVTSAATKVGLATANVGDILTKRDKEKYKEKSENFTYDIHDVNLAEIEKTVQKLEKANPDSDVKLKVSTYVNPYNLKTIQISAEQLLTPTGENKENNSLRLRWNKEVAKTYAAFTNIMDIDKVSIVKDDFGANLNNKKIDEKVGRLTGNIKDQKIVSQIQNNLPLEPGIVNFSSLKTGLWCYYSFKFKDELYNTSIAPVADAFKQGIGLFQITSSFNTINIESNTIDANQKFFDAFSSKSNDATRSDIKVTNVYFLIKDGQQFPQASKSINFKIFVLNEYVYNDNTSAIFIKKNISEQKFNTNITDNLLTKFDKGKYIQNIDTLLCQKFNEVDFEKWKPAFKFSGDQADIKFNDFQTGRKPKFLKDDKIMNLIKRLSEYLNK